MSAGLEVFRLSKEYLGPGGSLRVLSGVEFTLEAGESAAITGPSGSGKSSLLYVLGGLEPPTAGAVRLGGKDLYSMKPAELAQFRNREIGFVFQDHCLLPQCSVLENVLVPTLVRPADADERRALGERARDLVHSVGLSEREDHRPAELSGGEKQRVAIARALISQPGLLLCDEPTGNLDQNSADVVSALLLDLHRELGNVLITVTHSLRLAETFPIRFELAGGRLARFNGGSDPRP